MSRHVHNRSVRPEKSEAIVLQTHASRERDKLVVFLTPLEGKKKGWAYGARSLKSRFGSSLEPLSKVRISWMEREGEEIVRIESTELLRSLFDVHRDLAGSLAATYLAELADTFAQSGEASELLFRLIDNASDALAAGAAPVAVIAWADVWILKIGGIFPSPRNCVRCGEALRLPLHFNSEAGGFTCPNCAGQGLWRMPNDVSSELGRLLRSTAIDYAKDATAESSFEIRSLARSIRRAFLGHELKSHDLLSSVIGS
jgi:DNA repair protein RecO (recombination protein O)